MLFKAPQLEIHPIHIVTLSNHKAIHFGFFFSLNLTAINMEFLCQQFTPIIHSAIPLSKTL